MPKRKLKQGDRVELVKPYNFDNVDYNYKGSQGTVTEVTEDHYSVISFDINPNTRVHVKQDRLKLVKE